MLKGKKIVLGITGSIAAYKSAFLLRLLVRKGAEVQVVMTPAAKEFITPVSLSPLSGKAVVSEFFTANNGLWHSHVDLGLWADLMIIAPATAATIGKMANGIADNMLITTYLSMKAPVFVAPAMDLDMYQHPSTIRNLRLLASYGNHIIEPASGELASGLEGKGRMEEPELIVAHLEKFFSAQLDLINKKILISAGPTQETIDPVRFISNHSSGKMAYALAEECANRGAQVELVSGPVALQTQHPSIHRTDVKSAAEMYDACLHYFPSMDIGILCAAVADFTPENPRTAKIKSNQEGLNLRLQATKDIAFNLGNLKQAGQILIGFALESNNELENAQAKLERKKLDFIVLNSLNDPGAGFEGDSNKISIIEPQGKVLEFPLKSKQKVAEDIVNHLIQKL